MRIRIFPLLDKFVDDLSCSVNESVINMTKQKKEKKVLHRDFVNKTKHNLKSYML